MSTPDAHAELKQKLADIVRAFEPVGPTRYAKLLPIKEMIAELRRKGAGYGVIRNILASVGVSVAIDTLGRFCREEIEKREPRPLRSDRQSRQAKRPTTMPRPAIPGSSASSRDASVEAASDNPSPASSPAMATHPASASSPEPASQPTGGRGPRIADASKL
ncbi:MAG: hypothetical protein JWL59_4833 [Chthoniobacteraceae bacterium]|nr:hypothetical protein [Chthoniobacteraceae bacterium]